jgi:pseudouridine kinase
LDRALLLSPDAERARYTLHDNSLKNVGYKRYLEDFLASVVGYPEILNAGFCDSWRFFDYGSGPEPALVSLMRERGFEARGWDPFFAPEEKCYPGGADIVTCLEVAEHFIDPEKDFASLASCVSPGGFLALGTHLLDDLPRQESSPDAETYAAFSSWWYRQDPTHVSFYTKKSLVLIAHKLGLEWLGAGAAHTYIFRKEGGR